MNYLAHIYLSGENDLVTIGNFIADGIKGKQYQPYPKKIKIGILLHRHIDTFTDAHPVVRQSTKRLHAKYGHYSGIIVDILYDHFLAKNWTKYHHLPLTDFVENFYNSLHIHYTIVPTRIRRMMPYMISENWLVSYATIEGIAKVLNGMNKRTKNRSGMHNAINELQEYYTDFENEFTIFFEALEQSSKEKLIALNHSIK